MKQYRGKNWNYVFEVDDAGQHWIVQDNGDRETYPNHIYTPEAIARYVRNGEWVEVQPKLKRTDSQLEQFRSGLINSLPTEPAGYTFANTPGVHVRLRVRDGLIETSTGRKVPADAGLVRRILDYKGTGKVFGDRDGMVTTGLFPGQSFDFYRSVALKEGFRVGCHQFPWEDLEYVLNQLEPKPVLPDAIAQPLIDAVANKIGDLLDEHEPDVVDEVVRLVAASQGYSKRRVLPTRPQRAKRSARKVNTRKPKKRSRR